MIIHTLINDLLLSKFIQACHTDGCIPTKNNFLVSFDGVFDSFFKLFLCFHETSCSYIISFCNLRKVKKSLLAFLLHLKKSIIIITQHVTLLFICIGVIALFNIYFRMIIFALFVDKINLQHSRCIAIHVIWNILTMKICLYAFFPSFQLTVDVLAFSFYWFCRQFFK